jgi:3-methyladenine DNA glycosylase AlkD
MQREIAEAMMHHALAQGPDMNRLCELSEQLEGDERTRVRKLIGEILAANATLVLEISREHPDLDPDRGAP